MVYEDRNRKAKNGDNEDDYDTFVFDNIDDEIAFAVIEEEREREGGYDGGPHPHGCGCMPMVSVISLLAAFVLAILY